MSAIFGGSKQKQQQQQQSQSTQNSSSWNAAYPSVSNLYGGEAAQRGVNAGGMVSDALMGGEGATQAYDAYKKSTGFDQLMKSAMGAVSGKFGALGLGNSGAAAREAQKTAAGLGQQNFGNWLQQLFGVQDRGMAGTSQMVQAGNRNESSGQMTSSGSSSGSSNSKNGLGGFLGAALSDRRAKKDITKVGELDNGLGLYKFTYLDGDTPFIGVMAQEVAELAPYALGPTTADGYMTVNYDKLGIQMVAA